MPPVPPTSLPIHTTTAPFFPPHPPHPTITSHVTLPEFDGSQNVEGFLTIFELGCMELGLGESSIKVSLMGKLKGAAAAWLQGLGQAAMQLSYAELRQQLKEHFGGEATSPVRALQRLQQKGGDLVLHNTKFTMEAAAATPMMCPLWVKELYVGSLSNADL